MVRGAAVDEQVVGLPDPLPAPVTVHRVVAADHAGHARAGTRFAGLFACRFADLFASLLTGLLAGRAHARTPSFEGLDRAGASSRERVAAVGEAVHEQLFRAQVPGQLDQLTQVIEARVHATV